MTTNHTPGEWTIRSNEPLVDAPFSIMKGEIHIATISHNMRVGSVQQKTEVEANAKLIAAAPDLLEALRAARMSLKELAKSAWEHTSLAPLIDAAIKKATK